MASNINITTIDTSFPVPGKDNDTQGFRSNFSAIANALSTASSEISDIQVIQTGLSNRIANFSFPSVIVAGTATISNLTATSVSAVSVTATGVITASSFVGDGSGLVNLPNDNTKLSLVSTNSGDSTTATITVNNGGLIISGVSGISLSSSVLTTSTFMGVQTVGTSVDVIYLGDVDLIYPGSVFRVGTNQYTVNSVTTQTNVGDPGPTSVSIMPTPLTVFSAITTGTELTFTQGSRVGDVAWARARPATSVGKVGDKKGMVYADTGSVYVCFSDYVNTLTNIWAKVNTVSASW